MKKLNVEIMLLFTNTSRLPEEIRLLTRRSNYEADIANTMKKIIYV